MDASDLYSLVVVFLALSFQTGIVSLVFLLGTTEDS